MVAVNDVDPVHRFIGSAQGHASHRFFHTSTHLVTSVKPPRSNDLMEVPGAQGGIALFWCKLSTL